MFDFVNGMAIDIAVMVNMIVVVDVTVYLEVTQNVVDCMNNIGIEMVVDNTQTH